jgi:hypothetical protein
VDVSTAAGVATVAERVLDRLGGVDVVVNNAGSQTHGPDGALAMTDEDWQRDFDTNLFSAVRLDRLLPSMLSQGSGVIIHVTSGQARAASHFDLDPTARALGANLISKFGVCTSSGTVRANGEDIMGIKRIWGVQPGWMIGIGLSALALAIVGGVLAVQALPPADAPDPGSTRAAAGPSQLPREVDAVASAGTPGAELAASTPSAAPAAKRPATPNVGSSTTRRGPLLLWPFTSSAEVAIWEASYRADGHQPWHASPCETASSFVQYVLGYSDVTEVAECTIRAGDAWVTVGYPGEGRVNAIGATIHLVRIGSNPGGWVVVGSRDRATLTLSTPGYGATVTRSIHLAGRVSGLGEDMLRVRIMDRSGHSLGQAPARPIGLGGSWSADIRLADSPERVLIAVASTDSGLGSLGGLALTALVPTR